MDSFTFFVLLNVSLRIAFACALSRGNTYNSKIRFYTGPTVANFVSYNLQTAQNVADHPHFDSERRNMIFIHGWRQSPDSPASQVLIDAHIANGNFNIFALDWSEAAASFIVDVVLIVERLGIGLASFIDRWNSQKGVPLSKIHLVGHSLGAHLAGCAGKYIQRWSGYTKYIDRITGLDPAVVAINFLQWRYARFVDNIHTDANGFGTNKCTGHVDFWPNNGVSVQPGCPPTSVNRGCSHIRAIFLYAESVRRANCSYIFLSINKANANISIEMGLNCPTSHVQGEYTLFTNGDSWFSKT